MPLAVGLLLLFPEGPLETIPTFSSPSMGLEGGAEGLSSGMDGPGEGADEGDVGND